MLGADFWKSYFSVYDVLNLCIPYRELIEELVTALDPKPGERILDAGGGTGNVAVNLAKFGAEVTVFDFSKEALDICRKKNGNIKLFCGDLTKELPFPDNHFDKVVSNNTLHTILREKRNAAISEIRRTLRSGGKFVISSIKVGFSPLEIYKDHINKARKQDLQGAVTTLLEMAYPTIKMFYYNALVKKENRNGGYAFFAGDEQKLILKSAGFKLAFDSKSVYAGQAILDIAEK